MEQSSHPDLVEQVAIAKVTLLYFHAQEQHQLFHNTFLTSVPMQQFQLPRETLDNIIMIVKKKFQLPNLTVSKGTISKLL